jgi:monoamine oxidase
MHWPTHPWTLGSYACFRPGQWTTLRGAIGEPVGNLHFAGEHCAFDNQGFMEGGVETGEWAAQAILGKSVAEAAWETGHGWSRASKPSAKIASR